MREWKQLSLRIPAETKDFLQEEARINHRTLQGEVMMRIEKTIQQQRQERREEAA